MMSIFKKFSKTNLSTKRSGLNTTTRINTQTRLNTYTRISTVGDTTEPALNSTTNFFGTYRSAITRENLGTTKSPRNREKYSSLS